MLHAAVGRGVAVAGAAAVAGGAAARAGAAGAGHRAPACRAAHPRAQPLPRQANQAQVRATNNTDVGATNIADIRESFTADFGASNFADVVGASNIADVATNFANVGVSNTSDVRMSSTTEVLNIGEINAINIEACCPVAASSSSESPTANQSFISMRSETDLQNAKNVRIFQLRVHSWRFHLRRLLPH